MRKRYSAAMAAVAVLGIAGGAYWIAATPSEPSPFMEARPVLTDAELDAYCEEAIGPPRVEAIGDHMWVAIGYDLANVILVRRDTEGLLIDTAMSPARAKVIRDALLAASPGPIHHIVLTHSHIDHIGGLSVWMDGESTPPAVWATDAFTPHLFKQYGSFREAELVRGARQFGRSVSTYASPCSGLGAHADVDAALESGVRLPTHTFTGHTTLTLGDWDVHLYEAHGETHDQLYVHIPALDAVFPGDNWYRTFPNLYTIRGTSPRPIDAWIASLDAMRALEPVYLVPSHTRPVVGRDAVQQALTVYRDGIQWVRDQTTRRANAGDTIDTIAASIGLPPELASEPTLREFYGQIDWSARAIYDASLGWFDGTPGTLYPPPPDDTAVKTVAAMGGEEAVAALIRNALSDNDARWALHVCELLRRAGGDPLVTTPLYIEALEATASTVQNTNGRSYLLEYARELAGTTAPFGDPSLSDALITAIPLPIIFSVLQTKLIPERAEGVHETLRFQFEEADSVTPDVFVTVRHRIAEVAYETPLPGTPAPFATLRCTPQTWRELALGLRTPQELALRGDLRIDGNPLHVARFFDRFERAL